MRIRRARTNGPGEEDGAGWNTDTELPAAAASSPPPRRHQETADTGARRSMAWRKNGPSSPPLLLLPSRGGEGRWETTRKEAAPQATQGRPPRSGRKERERGSAVGAGGMRCGGWRASGSGGSSSGSPIAAAGGGDQMRRLDPPRGRSFGQPATAPVEARVAWWCGPSTGTH
uniref:Uncharacterized protein n=1 Tax=Oryza glumipatula TaxID=40148 RepID=A0A0D9YAE6_9ORYZ